MNKYEQTTAPANEPLTLTEAKAQLRVDGTDEDTLIGDLIQTVREKFEASTGRVLSVRDFTAFSDTWPDDNTLALPLYPVLDVSSVKYKDEDGTEQTLAAANYTVDKVGITPRIVLNDDADAPEVGNYPNAVYVRFAAGSYDIPQSAKQSMLLWLTMLYERREDMNLSGSDAGTRSGEWLSFNHRKDLI